MTAMVETPPPRLVASAIADLAAEQVRESWRYLDEFAALQIAGVPAATIRDCLADPLDTEPLREMVAWIEAGERGLLCLVGLPGTGKTFAEARWVLDRHRRGLHTHWLAGASLPMASLRQREERLTAVADVRALVIDDVGAGAGKGDYLRDQILGLLQHRIDSLRPTVIASNAKREEMDDWLGARVADRARVFGGTIAVQSKKSLRAESEAEIDASGRGPEWKRHARIVALIGCEKREKYDEDGRRLADALVVGDVLYKDARREGFEACKRARKMLGLDSGRVAAKAIELGIAEASTLEWAEGTLGVKVAAMSISFEGVVAAWAEKLRQQQAAQQQERDRLANEQLARSARRIEAARGREAQAPPFADAKPPAWATGPEGRKQLRAFGFRVEPFGDGFALHLERWGRRQWYADSESADRLWLFAAQLCAVTDESTELQKD